MKRFLAVLLMSFNAFAYSNPSDEILDSIDANKYYAAEFQDGIGARWNGKQLVTKKASAMSIKKGNEPVTYENIDLNIPDDFDAGWPKFAMNGVLSCGSDYYDTLHDVTAGEFKCSTFYVYEVPNQPGDIKARLDVLKKWLKNHPVANIGIIDSHQFSSENELENFFNQAVAKGREGIVLSPVGAEYNSDKFKFITVRKFYKDLCVINTINYDEKGELASYECTWQTANGYRAANKAQDRERLSFLGMEANIKISDGFSDEHRKKPLKVGTQIGFRYSALDDSGLPSRPYFLKDF